MLKKIILTVLLGYITVVANASIGRIIDKGFDKLGDAADTLSEKVAEPAYNKLKEVTHNIGETFEPGYIATKNYIKSIGNDKPEVTTDNPADVAVTTIRRTEHTFTFSDIKGNVQVISSKGGEPVLPTVGNLYSDEYTVTVDKNAQCMLHLANGVSIALIGDDSIGDTKVTLRHIGNNAPACDEDTQKHWWKQERWDLTTLIEVNQGSALITGIPNNARFIVNTPAGEAKVLYGKCSTDHTLSNVDLAFKNKCTELSVIVLPKDTIKES